MISDKFEIDRNTKNIRVVPTNPNTKSFSILDVYNYLQHQWTKEMNELKRKERKEKLDKLNNL